MRVLTVGVGAMLLLSAACSGDNPGDAPTVTEEVLPPAGTDVGVGVGDVQEPLDEDVTGGAPGTEG